MSEQLEIERKYTVKSSSWKRLKRLATKEIVQFYTSIGKHSSTRYRIIGDIAIYTRKEGVGVTRKENEFRVHIDVARRELARCKTTPILKTRYEVLHKGNKWEVDVFKGENVGLVIAEIELKSESQHIHIPSWIDKEVTFEPRYLNASLAKKPYSKWKRK